nr:nucleoside-diphosphate sugar epimerase/dehydratase [Desulfobaculum xiamenense]
MKSINFYVLIALDAGLVSVAHLLAYLTRFEFDIPPQHLQQLVAVLPMLVPIKLVCFLSFDLYKGMWRYTSLPELVDIAKGTAVASVLVLAYVVLFHNFQGFSRSVFILDALYTVALVAGLRLGIRMVYGTGFVALSSMFTRRGPTRPRTPCVLLGMGEAGEGMLRESVGNPNSDIRIVAIFDDDKSSHGRCIHGVPVVGALDALPEWKRIEKFKTTEALIATPAQTGEEMRHMMKLCEDSGLTCRRIPSLSEIAAGRVSIKNLRDVNYRDLLGREPVNLDVEGIAGYLRGKTVLVTGAGGSIGSELCRQIAGYGPRKLLLLDASEFALYTIQMELEHELRFHDYETLLGSLCDGKWLRDTLETHRPDVIFHAAAYKHVPMLEVNPWQAIYNNVLATQSLIGHAVRLGVPRLLVVSTDKAVRPTSVMGASKRVTERIMQSHCGNGTRLMAVRFGNVLGSAGSVVPLFRRQIECGGPVTVTHPDVVRYFMTIEEACQLILQAGSMGEGGEIFVLRMGRPVRIADMAADLIRLSGREPGRDVEIRFTGLRPGEKLYEELITQDEGVVPTGHNKIMVLRGQTCESAELAPLIDDLKAAADARDHTLIRQNLVRIVPEYTPDDGS